MDKLYGAFISRLSEAHGMVELNTRVLATWYIRSRKVTIKTKDEESKTVF